MYIQYEVVYTLKWGAFNNERYVYGSKVAVWLRCAGYRVRDCWSSSMSRIQILDVQIHHKERGRQGFTRFDKMSTSSGQKRERERDLLIYKRLQDDCN